MLEFIIYEKNKEYQNKCKNLIDQIMMGLDLSYMITVIDAYNSNWKELLNSDRFKIYILNIDTRKESGLDISNYIRYKQNDWQSMIIITSCQDDYRYKVSEYRLMSVDYVLKNESFNKKLSEAIKISLKNYDSRPNTLKYTYKGVLYNIAFSKIIYIEKEPESKRCIIKTETKEFYSSGNLRHFENKLDKRFIKCNRSFIINIEQVEQYNIKDNIITFKSQETLSTISREKKKEIMNYLRGL